MFLFLMASAAMVSCGSDDGESSAKLPSNVALAAGPTALNYSFSFDDKRNLTQLVRSGSEPATVQITYGSNGKASGASKIAGGTTTSYTFGYDSEGRLNSYTPQGQPTVNLTWTNDNTMSYDGNTYTFTDKGDIVLYQTLAFNYANAKKGPFANAKYDAFILTLLDNQSPLFATRQPISSISAGGQVIIMNNTFESGYLATMTFSDNMTTGTMTVSYN